MTEKTLTMRNHLSLDAECYIEKQKNGKKKRENNYGTLLTWLSKQYKMSKYYNFIIQMSNNYSFKHK